MPYSRLFLAALALACQGAFAQSFTTVTTTTTTPAISVQRLAPQLVAFAGSQANFQNLVTGLAQGTPVQLVTVLPDGSAQVVNFTPAGTLTTEQIAQTLEAARQRLIGLGIATPTAEQLATALVGGTVPTALGGQTVTGALPQTQPSPAAQVQGNLGIAGAGATTPTTPTPTTPATAVNVQTIPATSTNTVAAGTFTGTTALAAPRTLTSDSPIPAGATSRSPVPTAPIVAPGAGSTTLTNPNPTAGFAPRR
jgi:hypothetical protein